MGDAQVVRVTTLAALIAGTIGCQFPRPIDKHPADAAVDAPGEPLYGVRGTLSGLWSGATVQLELTSPPDAPVPLSVTSNGEFAFPPSLPDDRSFSVAVATGGQPLMHACVVANGAGIVDRDQTPSIAVDCAFTAAVDITWSAPLPGFDFSVERLVYSDEAALGVQESSITVSGPAGIEWALDSQAFSTLATRSVPLPLSTNVVDITLRIGTFTNRYSFNIERSDPVVNDLAYLKASNTDDGDHFGAAVAASGSWVAVGAPDEDSAATGVGGTQSGDASTDSGAVYLFRRDGLTLTQIAYLKGAPNVAGAHFGASVAMRGDVLIVGAPNDGAIGEGAVYIYKRDVSGWMQVQRLTPPDPFAGLKFGASIALGDRWIVVGAPGDGVVYTYVANTTTTVWAPHETLMAPIRALGDQFGASVAIDEYDGARIIVGAPFDDGPSDALTDSGVVHLFLRTGPVGTPGTWAHEGTFSANGTEPGDHFGAAVAATRGRVVVGADGDDGDAASPVTDAGAVYVLERSGTTWTQVAELRAPTPMLGANLGASVATRGDLILAGSPTVAAGTTTLFQQIGLAWVPYAAVASPAVDAGDAFARSIALSGEGIYIGAPLEDGSGTGTTASPADNGASDTGAVHGYF